MATWFARRTLIRVIPPLGALCLGALLAMATIASLGAGTSPPAMSDMHYAAHLAGPAVVRIITERFATVTCAGCSANGADLVFPQAQPAYGEVSSGSGAFVSPDGDVLTAYHVVSPTCDDAVNGPFFLQLAHDEYVQGRVQGAADASAAAEAQFTQWEQRNQLIVRCASPQRTTVFLSSGFTGTLGTPSQLVSYPMLHIAASSPGDAIPGEGDDTAILQVAAHDMPYISLAPKGAAHVQDTVVALAFPADVDEADFVLLLQPAGLPTNVLMDLLTPTLESGTIIAEKTQLNSDTSVFDTTDLGFHGSSGGAVLDPQGQLVGFVDNGPETARFTQVIESSVVDSYLQMAERYRPLATGTLMGLWTRAVADEDAEGACHWAHAGDDLRRIRARYPQFTATQADLQTAQSQPTPVACRLLASKGPSLQLVASGAGLLVLVPSVIVLVLRRRGSHPETRTVREPRGRGQGSRPRPASTKVVNSP